MFDSVLVHEYLRASAKRFSEKEALICGEERVTYGRLDGVSDAFAIALRNLGLKRQDRVVIFLDNSVEAVIALYGTLKAGGVFVILESSTKSKKLRYVLNDSGASFLVTHMTKAPVASDAIEDTPQLRHVVWVGDGAAMRPTPGKDNWEWNRLIQCATIESDIVPASDTIDVDLATLIYTSGSTGEPKGVMSSHRNMISAAKSIIQYIGNTHDDIIIDVLPLSFDYGLYQVIMAFMFGGTVVLEKSFAFPVKVLERIRDERVTGFPVVPTIVAFLLKLRDLGKYDISSLRYVTNTAAALPVEHIRKLRELLPHVRLFSMYGLTECKRVSYLPPEELDRRIGSVGKAMPNTEVFVVDREGREVGPGVIGELVIRGSHVMQGYWNAPQLTAETYRPGRYPGERVLYSGDLFRMDDEGFLYFIGRKDDMIKSKGERVSPREIENVLCEMTGVHEAAVIGVPDEMLGQAIKAFIIVERDTMMTEKEVLAHCSRNLETFKIPKYVEFLKDLPRTPNGKVDKKALRER